MAAKSRSCNFPEELSVGAKVITSQFWQNYRQIRDCFNVDTLEPHMQEQFMLTADNQSYLRDNVTRERH